MIKSIEWTGESLKIIDQTRIPHKILYKELRQIQEVYEAIRKLEVRGAPAIGVAAAFGLYLGLKSETFTTSQDVISRAGQLAEYLSEARPTAVNLRWAISSVMDRISHLVEEPEVMVHKFLEAAIEIQEDDKERCRRIGESGAGLIESGMTVLTHCNTGALATAGIGTAFGVLYTAHLQGKKFEVMVDETRPLLQGARLTMWELKQAEIPATLITDSMAAYAMQQRKIDLVMVGADRIAGNGDVANKVGTYNLAVAADFHRIPFYVAAPLSTFDFSLTSGENIPIEERDPSEVTHIGDELLITIPDANSWNPAFDVTPFRLISGIITENGIITPPFEKSIQHLIHHTYQN
ncbi:MAG: S-methyl-5-thioribose-1-phosphate isomerase [Calditrichaeota bacterium]|nr:S-methyl-5-thioribose-1-phosphate isomerase [Calditrichota bacterium]